MICIDACGRNPTLAPNPARPQGIPIWQVGYSERIKFEDILLLVVSEVIEVPDYAVCFGCFTGTEACNWSIVAAWQTNTCGRWRIPLLKLQ